MEKSKKFYYFANYFDVVINVIFAIIVATMFISLHDQKDPVYHNLAILTFLWAGLIYLSLLFINGPHRYIISFFLIPLKMGISYLFIFSIVTLISAITDSKAPIGRRISDGLSSGILLYLCHKFVKN